jgi:hypothetical protein
MNAWKLVKKAHVFKYVEDAGTRAADVEKEL